MHISLEIDFGELSNRDHTCFDVQLGDTVRCDYSLVPRPKDGIPSLSHARLTLHSSLQAQVLHLEDRVRS